MASAYDLIHAITRNDKAAFIIAIDPRAADALIPKHGFAQRAGSRVALNPQPLPPAELSLGAALLYEVTRAAIAGAGSEDAGAAARLVSFEIDDWCGTGWPRKWPKPKSKLDVLDVFLGAAIAADDLAGRYEGSLGEALAGAAKQLADQAIG
ncbi:hypothetical protein FH969_08770 [Miniimonas arenae]|uniref:Uncharacterized protein n=1 Tax=Miniimonas arenae TaxID=676201 RepID=A0A5C5BCI3_9MICO|nr:hypothetical protein [Miniimonas arenae]TNU73935.1 hypothetical protein FH969_08770 [Miniimonas arenae]